MLPYESPHDTVVVTVVPKRVRLIGRARADREVGSWLDAGRQNGWLQFGCKSEVAPHLPESQLRLANGRWKNPCPSAGPRGRCL